MVDERHGQSGLRAGRGLVVFPGALGDFLCFLPALAALRRRHARLTLVAQASFGTLLDAAGVEVVAIHRREVADLFSSDTEPAAATRALFGGHTRVYSWSGSGQAEFAGRLAVASDGQVEVFAFRGMRPAQHAADYYAACVDADGRGDVADLLRFDTQWLEEFLSLHGLQPRAYLVLHPGSGSRHKNWHGFAALLRGWRESCVLPVVGVCGPVECERESALPRAITAADLTLPQLATLLRGARFYVGNDSGVSHLAGVVGVPGLALFGNSDAAIWAPRGAVQVVEAASACAQCEEEGICTHRLPVEGVLARLRCDVALI